MEKTEEDLQREIEELHRQHRQITDRLRDPRGLRRGGFSGASSRNGARPRGFIRPAERNEQEDQPPTKRRLLSTVVKVEDGAETEAPEASVDIKKKQLGGEATVAHGVDDQNDARPRDHFSGFAKNESQRVSKRDNDIPMSVHLPRVLPKNEDPRLVNRNKRMLGQLLGTLERFRKEDMAISGTEAYMQRSNALQRAEQKAKEESERLRQQEREQIAEKRRRDLTLRARVAAKAEEKKLELLFIRWSDHQKRLSNFIRTKAEPPIYYLPNKPLVEDISLIEQQKEKTLSEWKAVRREELSEYQKQIADQCLANVEKELERWQNARARKAAATSGANLQETMDKELDTHRLEHGPKLRKIPGAGNEDDEDVEDINVGEDDMMDDVLGVDDTGRRDETVKTEAPDAYD